MSDIQKLLKIPVPSLFHSSALTIHILDLTYTTFTFSYLFTPLDNVSLFPLQLFANSFPLLCRSYHHLVKRPYASFFHRIGSHFLTQPLTSLFSPTLLIAIASHVLQLPLSLSLPPSAPFLQLLSCFHTSSGLLTSIRLLTLSPSLPSS